MRKVLQKTQVRTEPSSRSQSRKIKKKEFQALELPPFALDIHDANSTENCCIYLYPQNIDKLSNIEFIVKFSKNAQTGKHEYNIVYYNENKVQSDVTKKRVLTRTDEFDENQSTSEKKFHLLNKDSIVLRGSKIELNQPSKKIFPGIKPHKTPVGKETRYTELKRNCLYGERDRTSNIEDNVSMPMMTLEEGYMLTNQLREMGAGSKAKALEILMQVIDLEKNFVSYALSAKMVEERKFIQELLKAKETRQSRFICDLMNVKFDSEKTEFLKTVAKQLDTENQLILRSLNEKISQENNLLIKALKKEITANKEMIVTTSNKKCYQTFKRIIYRFFSEKVKFQIRQIQQEVSFNLTREREIILNEINKKVIK